MEAPASVLNRSIPEKSDISSMAAIDECNSNTILVRLHPFVHQVGGSALMFKFDDKTICKPLEPNEYHFYKLLPESLKQFTAQYKGSIEILYEECSDGSCSFYGVVPPEKLESLHLNLINLKESNAISSPHKNIIDLLQKRDELTVKRSGSVEMNSDSLDQYDNPHVKLQVGSRLNKGLTALLEGPHKKFILLEDLVANIQHPSILDLKMGTRTYGDEESDAKKSRKERRAENSTSKTLGVRLHGMQKYNVVTGKYETIDKYDGLKYKVDEFQSALRSFLNDGLSVRQELITPITHTLRKFYDCVSQQDTFRFYSSSLLIIYDSDPDRANPNVNIRAIDFAHTTYKSSPNSSQHTYSGPDKGYLLGLETVIDIFNGCAND